MFKIIEAAMNESTDESDWVPAQRIVELSSVLPFREVHLPMIR